MIPRTALFGRWFELQADGVDTIAQPGGFGSVFEDMSEMAIAAGAANFNPMHSVAVVVQQDHAIFGGHSEERWPAAAGIELGV